MTFQFNAELIFEIGVQIERNGKTFYLEAAKKASDEASKTLFTELADWESAHIALFQQLKAELPDMTGEDNLFDPENELVSYLQAAADSHVFENSADIAYLVAQCHSSADVIDLAITFEKDSVVYYTTMKKVVPEYLGQARIDRLIDEELKHIAILNTKKKLLTA
ncbi:MAG: ferritin family protein [Candidatus Vecturithrix sp.]|jgi:rubrerythrin|nr:ferritin family protein [Candidatus Vecturithrix sp.]